MAKRAPKNQAEDADAVGVSSPSRISFDFIKSQAFRVIHVDGIWGGIRPDLTFHMSLYNERHAIPRRMTLDFDPEDLSGGEAVEIEDRGAIVREVEVCAIINMETAKDMRDWLDTHLKRAKERIAEAEAEAEADEEAR